MLPSRLAACCARVVPVSGVGISVFLSNGVRVPVGASTEAAADAERLQFTTGEGPCLAAVKTGRAVFATEAVTAREWPHFSERLTADTPYCAVTAMPLTTRGCVWAAVDLFFHRDADLLELPLLTATVVVDLAGAALLRSIDTARDWLTDPAATARLTTLIAAGKLNTALRVTTEQALDLMRARAYATNTTVDAVAADIADNRLPVVAFDLNANT